MRKFKLVLCFILCVILSGCDYFSLSSTRQIYGEIEVTEDWKEIIPDPPLRIKKQNQRVFIYVPNGRGWDMAESSSGCAFRKPDKTVVKIDLQLIDNTGNSYNLNSPALAGCLGLSYFRKDKPKGKQGLPKDIKIVKLRIRSSVKFTATKIEWVCYIRT